MFVFYGLDNFLVNQAVDNYLKTHYLNQNFQESIITYYLEPETLELTIERILNEASSLDLFNNKKIIIINDYYLALSNNSKILISFISKLEQFSNNIVILKVLTNKLKPHFLNGKNETFFINSYSKEQLRKWIINWNVEHKINFEPKALEIFIAILPNALTIIDNELKMLKNLNQVITTAVINKLNGKYFTFNPYQLISFWLKKDYQTFWFQYRSYWDKINYDKANLLAIVVYQLELIRNIKLLSNNNLSNQEIIKTLNISIIQLKSLLKYQLEIKEINHMLCSAHELDFKIKSGKITKNLAIDLFFCKIYGIIL